MRSAMNVQITIFFFNPSGEIESIFDTLVTMLSCLDG